MNEELKTTKDQPTSSSSPLKRQRRANKLPKWREGFTGYPSPPSSSQQPTKITPPALTTSPVPGKKPAVKKSSTEAAAAAAAALPGVSPSKAGPSSAATTTNPPPTTAAAIAAIESGSRHSNKIHNKKSTPKPAKAKKPPSSVPTAAQKELEARQRLERAQALQAAREAAIDKQAITIMTRELHIPLNKAKEALDETKNEAKLNSGGGGGGGEVDLDTWVEAAQIWLAMAQEVTDEHIQLGEAMEVSLAEAEQRRQKIKPIEERTAEEIAAVFESSSTTMKTLVDECNMAVRGLFGEVGGEMRNFMVEWLTLEQNCKKWYAVSRYYFDMVAEEVKAMYVNDSDGGNVALRLLLGQKMDIVKQAVFTMPEVETTAGWVPQLFLDAAKGKEEDVVEILD